MNIEGDITDVPRIRVGHWTDPIGQTGCTVVLLPDEGAVASVDVRGAAPGTRETDLLQPGRTVERVHAIVLSGGSAFGLAAADGVMSYLADHGVGFSTDWRNIPIVPAAVIFDLSVGDPNAAPSANSGLHACIDAEAGSLCGQGRFGAGTGATVAKMLGASKPGGIGTASLTLPGGGTIGALAVVNAIGDIVGADGASLTGTASIVSEVLQNGLPQPPVDGQNTTLVVVATDVVLTKTQAHRLSEVVHDGFAHAIRPVHTAMDGDTAFVVSTGNVKEHPVVLEIAAVEVVAAAIRAAVS